MISVLRGLGGLEFALNKCLVDDHLGGDVRQFAFLPGLHLFSQRLETSLHPVDADGDTDDERERLRVDRITGLKPTVWDGYRVRAELRPTSQDPCPSSGRT